MVLNMNNIFPVTKDAQDEFFNSVADSFLKPSMIIKSVDEVVTSSTVLQNDDELFFPNLESDSYYELELNISVAVNSTPDFKYAFTVPAGTIGIYSLETSIRLSGAGAATSWNGYAIPSAEFNEYRITQPIATTGTILCTSNVMEVTFRILIKTSNTAGSINFKWAQNTSSGTETRVYAGSYMFIKKYGVQ